MIDTLTYAKKLENVGFTKEQAETLIMLSSELSFHHLATKEDMRLLRSELKADIGELRSELKAELVQLRSELKSDMAALQGELKSDMLVLRADTKTDMQSLEHRLTLRIGIMMGTMFTVFFAALTFVIQLKG